MENKPLYSKRNALREFFCFKDVERLEITAYATRFNPEEKAMEAAAAIEQKMAEEGRELLSIEVFQNPVSYTPFSSITIIVRSPVEDKMLGAALTTVVAILLGTIATVALAALGYFVYKIVSELEPADQARVLKMVGIAALLFGSAAVLREGRMLFSERG